MNILVIKALSALALVAAVWFGIHWLDQSRQQIGYDRRVDEDMVELAKAKDAARAKEAQWQGAYNEADKQWRTKNDIAERRLGIALNSLRDRPERPQGVPDTPRRGCEGANGAELARSHGEFLARFAKRAEAQDNALAACYAKIDGLK